jgi:hypothetical protein
MVVHTSNLSYSGDWPGKNMRHYLKNKPQTLKLVQERIGNTLELIGIGKDFHNGTPATQK